LLFLFFFFFSSRRRHTRSDRDWSSDVCSSDLVGLPMPGNLWNRCSFPADKATWIFHPNSVADRAGKGCKQTGDPANALEGSGVRVLDTSALIRTETSEFFCASDRKNTGRNRQRVHRLHHRLAPP